MTKIDIISGFLGAGKTTLIKKLLDECFQGQKLVLIENEFGEISIDGGFLKDAGVQINEISSGCICCSLVGQFDEALHQVVKDYQPERVIIEPSGVGRLSDVSRAVGNAGKTTPMELGCAVAVVDPKRFKTFLKNFGEFYTDQIETAGTIVLSRTQDLSDEKLEAVVAQIREMNADATIITTPWDQIKGDAILSAMNHHSLADELMNEAREAAEKLEEEECDDPNCSCHHHHHHDHDEHDHEHHHHHDHEDHLWWSNRNAPFLLFAHLSCSLFSRILRYNSLTCHLFILLSCMATLMLYTMQKIRANASIISIIVAGTRPISL